MNNASETYRSVIITSNNTQMVVENYDIVRSKPSLRRVLIPANSSSANLLIPLQFNM
jgi:hypothetical protein